MKVADTIETKGGSWVTFRNNCYCNYDRYLTDSRDYNISIRLIFL